MKRLLVLLIAVYIGICCILPHILGYLEFKKKYELFSSYFTSDIAFDEIMFYAPPASYFKTQMRIPYETEIFEKRNVPNVKYFLPMVIEGTVAKLLKNTRIAWAINRFLFTTICFLLFYFLAIKLTNSMSIACFAGVASSLLGFGPRTFLSLCERNLSHPIFLSRMSAPAVDMPFLLIALIGLIELQKGRFKYGIALSGVFGGLLFYTYYHYHLTYIAVLILLAFAYAISSKMKKCYAILLSGIVSNVIAIPWYIQYVYAIRQSPAYISLWKPYFIIPSLYEITAAGLNIAILIMVFFIWKRDLAEHKNQFYKFLDSEYLPVAMIVFASLFLANIISAFIIPLLCPDHFLSRITFGFNILLLSCIAGKRMYSRYSSRKLLLFLPTFILLLLLIVKQTNMWNYVKKHFQADPQEQIAEELISKYTNRDEVVAIKSAYFNASFPARCWRFRFYASYGLSNVDSSENIKRYLFIQKIFNRDWPQLKRQLLSSDKIITALKDEINILCILSLRNTLSTGEEKFLEASFKAMNADFLNTRKLNYAVCLGTNEEQDLLAGTRKLGLNLSLVVRERDVSLYKIIGKNHSAQTS